MQLEPFLPSTLERVERFSSLPNLRNLPPLRTHQQDAIEITLDDAKSATLQGGNYVGKVIPL